MTESNEPEDWLQTFLMQQARERQAAQESLAALCEQLAAQGINQVQIDYNGYGDEGSVEDVTALAGEQEVSLEQHLYDALCDATYALLPPGWENNDGAFGQLVLDVAARKLTREHNWRVESTEYEEEEFAL